MLSCELSHRFEVYLTACGAHVKQELFCKSTILDIGQDLLHCFLGIFGNDLRTCDVIAVFSGVGNRISHACETGLIDQVNNQLHLMDALEVCVYYGEEKWDGPGCLKDMLKIPEKLQSLVSDYSMNLLQVRTSKPMQFRNPDVNTVFEASRFIYEKDYENLNAIYENKEIPSELGLVIGTITNSQSLIDRALEAEEKEGGQMLMCKALEELRMEGVLQGRTEGIRATVKTCKRFQISKEAIIETIGKEFSMPEKEVAEYVEKYW